MQISPVFALLLVLAATSIRADDGRCVTYGKCTENYLCAVDHPSKVLDDEDSMTVLREYCPEIVETYGNSLCCNRDQLADLMERLVFIRIFLSRCPSCYYNFRQSFCDAACSPYQYRFLSVNQTEVVEEDAVAAVSLNYYIGTEHVEKVYESCKDVQMGEDSGTPAMDYLCGPWQAANCTGQRMFEALGLTSNGYFLYDTFYHFMEDVDEDVPVFPGSDIVGWNNATYPCSEIPPDGSLETCSCSDCAGSCQTKKFQKLVLKF